MQLAPDRGAATAAAEAEVVGRNVRAGRSDWHAAAWWLEHRNPEGWGPKADERPMHRQMNEFIDRLSAGLAPAEFERILVLAAGDD